MNVPAFHYPLRITLGGLDKRAEARLTMFLKGTAHEICAIVEERDAEAAIFDFDGYEGERLWQEFRARFHGPVLVMSIRQQNLQNAVWVRKPVNTQELMKAIDLIRLRLEASEYPQGMEKIGNAPLFQAQRPATAIPSPEQKRRLVARTDKTVLHVTEGASRAAAALSEEPIHDFCGVLPDAAYRDRFRREDIFYQPEQYLQGLLQRARELAERAAQPVRIEVAGLMMIYFPASREVFCNLRDAILRPLCVTSALTRLGTLRIVEHGELPIFSPGDAQLHGYEKMLWLLTLWASRGRAPEKTNLDAPVILHHWPNLTRFPMIPKSIQIAALWERQPMSLMRTAESLSIPYRYVFAFYSACKALGLTDQRPFVQSTTPSPPTMATISLEKRSLLGSLLRKLRLTS